ncbi:RluA family pseudouridine synthase [Streptococcus devriesei]|uniref:RluA family pseudouridine synthase n=1 Tax=Streptococcus devriesei TaxID=231233 RepID=UPI0004181225|nr:RluA family pseudouridine synthase [Streptococcus devriesei]
MTFTVKITNPYPKGSVKELLEKRLLIPRKIRHFLRTKKHVFINGEMINWQSPVNTGDLIELIFDDSDYPTKTIPMGNKDLADCLYEDEHLIIVNKPEGMKVHGNEPKEIALLNHVSSYTGQTCYVVHRLDMETSGAVLFAKNPFILPIVNRLLENKHIQREYLALTAGQFPEKSLVFKERIGRDRHDRRKRVVDQKHGQTAITQVSLVRHCANHTSLVKCRLQTGRTHQIRVHLAYHGYPLIGDPLYNQHTAGRLMLHAYQLSFTHPLTLKKIKVQARSDSFEKELPK